MQGVHCVFLTRKEIKMAFFFLGSVRRITSGRILFSYFGKVNLDDLIAKSHMPSISCDISRGTCIAHEKQLTLPSTLHLR